MVEPGFFKIIYNNLRGRSDLNNELPSMFMFASQLNAEMVYSILKGITQFSKVSFENIGQHQSLRQTSKDVIPTYSENGVDAIVVFESIKIKVKDWSPVLQEDLQLEIIMK